MAARGLQSPADEREYTLAASTTFAVFALLVLALAAPAAAGPRADDPASLAREAIAAAAKARGLEPKTPLRTDVARRDDIERYVSRRIDETGARSEFAVTSAVLAAFGVVPAGYDVEALVRRIAREQIAGYYDPERKTLFVADWIPAFLQRPTLVHEVTHALQDQHFGLARFMKPLKGCSEPSAAVAALVEGDATAVMLDAIAGEPIRGDDGARLVSVMEKLNSILSLASGFAGVPRVLRETLFFPYMGGVRMVLLTRRDDWKAVDALYADPPVSTEQVLHPERLAGARRDAPHDVRFPSPAPGPGWTRVGTDQVGELGLRLVLEETLPKDEAARAAEGWDGDRLVAWRRGAAGPVAVVWASVWDSAADAAEAEAALRRTSAPPVAIERRDATIAGVWGDRSVDAARLIGAAWGGLKTRELPTWDDWRRACR